MTCADRENLWLHKQLLGPLRCAQTSRLSKYRRPLRVELVQVVTAISKQLATLNTNARYLHEGLCLYAEELVTTFPEPLSVSSPALSPVLPSAAVVKVLWFMIQQKWRAVFISAASCTPLQTTLSSSHGSLGFLPLTQLMPYWSAKRWPVQAVRR